MSKAILSLLVLSLTVVTGFAQCSQLLRRADQQGDRVVVMTTCPGRRSSEPVHYQRIQQNGITEFFVQLYVQSVSFLPQKGVSILFKNGTALEWTEASVEAIIRNNQYVSRCLIRVTEPQIEQLQEQEILSIKLGTHERYVSHAQSERAKNIINCVIGADLLDIKPEHFVSQL